MKNPIKVLLRGGVFVLAAVFAFAFTEPKTSENVTKWANDPNSPQPVNITGQQMGIDYNCSLDPEPICTYETDAFGVLVPNSEERGVYSL